MHHVIATDPYVLMKNIVGRSCFAYLGLAKNNEQMYTEYTHPYA